MHDSPMIGNIIRYRSFVRSLARRERTRKKRGGNGNQVTRLLTGLVFICLLCGDFPRFSGKK